MTTKNSLVVLVLSLWTASWLSSQSLAELSKKEKARRASVKSSGIIVTNADLGKVKKKAALITAQPESPGQESRAGNPPRATEGGIPAEDLQSSPSQESIPENPSITSVQQPPATEQEFQRQKAMYEEKWENAQERVDLLTLKLNALWQEFYNMSENTTRDKVQLEISETYSRLLKAQEDAAKAKEELDNFMAAAQRESVPSIWIR